MRAVILGGAGFIGAHLAARLLRGGWQICAADLPAALDELDRSSRRSHAFRRALLAGAQLSGVDIRDQGKVSSLLAAVNPDVVFCLTGPSTVTGAQSNIVEASESMARGVANVLEAVRGQATSKRFVFASSSMVYGDFVRDPVAENCRTTPVSIYGGFKLAAESLVRAYLYSSSVEPVIVRPSAVYGVGDSHRRIVPNICRAALTGESIIVKDPVKTVADFSAVEDVVEGLELAGSHPAAAGEIFNISRGRSRTLMELVNIAQRLAPGIEVVFQPADDPTRPMRGALDISKARELLGFTPKVDLEAGLAHCLASTKASAGAHQAEVDIEAHAAVA